MTSSVVMPQRYPKSDRSARGRGKYFYPPSAPAIRDNFRVTNEELRRVLARNLQAQMDSRGMVQEDLERSSALGQSTISRVLSCGGAATLDTVAALARGLNCSPWELLADDDATREAAIRKALGGK